MDNNTKLRIRKVDGVYEDISILMNGLLVFRGDVMHGGSSYSVENRRLYMKVFPAGCKLDEVELNAVGANDNRCELCGEEFECKPEWHRRMHCRALLSEEERERKKARNRKKSSDYRNKNRN